MALYPDVQKKAQAQLDEVLGQSRLPTFDDINSLPYIHSIILEVLRWMPPAPIGLPHRVMKDDEYKGLLIPKGALIVGVSRGFSYAGCMLKIGHELSE